MPHLTGGQSFRMRRATSIVVFVVALLMLPLPALASGPGSGEGGVMGPPPVSAAATSAPRGGGFRFFGSGWGHGLGMSQWGSYGLARKGWKYPRILTRFYSGTRVIKPAHRVRSLRVGLTYDRTLIHLGAKLKPVHLWIGKRHGTSVGSIPAGKTWTVRSARSGFAVRDAAGKLVGGHTWGGPSFHLYATYASTGARVFVPEADAIWGKGFTYARGSLEFDLYGCGTGGCRERVVLPIGLEDYLLGIGEVPSSWPAEALRAQAVAARTFATYTVRHYARRGYCNCDLEDGSNDQTYVGYDKESGPGGKRWVAAVRSTAGKVVAYHGNAVQAFYAASDGGHSDSVQDVWHDGNPAFAVPYLKGVCDPGEYTPANPWTNWSRSFTAASLTSRLHPYTGGIGTVTGFPKVKRGGGGRIIHATVNGGSGHAVVSGSELRAALVLPDDRVWIGSNKNIVGPIRTKYDALDCAPGLPSSPTGKVPGGARQLFHMGGIFRNNGAGVTIWLKGPIYSEYRAVGGATGTLGLPTTGVGAVGAATRSAGSRVLFKRGRIYLKSGVGAHALWGKVLKAYLGDGGATGELGFPRSRPHAGGAGTWASFEHGRINCPSGGACQVHAS